jgi:hypothetical protein
MGLSFVEVFLKSAGLIDDAYCNMGLEGALRMHSDDGSKVSKSWRRIAKTEDEMSQSAERLVAQIEKKGLHNLLECTLDESECDDFGGVASLYHAFVDVIAHETRFGQIAFTVRHPADDRDKCPSGKPEGFMVPWDFDVKDTARMVRKLAIAARGIYKNLNIDPAEYYGAMDLDSQTADDGGAD